MGAETQTKVLDLRRQGWSLDDIAEELGTSTQSVKNALSQAFSAAIDQGRALMALNLELERLDELTKAYWEKAIGAGGQELDPKAAELILKVSGHRAKLMGLEVGNAGDGATSDLISVLARLARARESAPDSTGSPVTLEALPEAVCEGSVQRGPGGLAGDGPGRDQRSRPPDGQERSRGRQVDEAKLVDPVVVIDKVPGESRDDGPDRAPVVRHPVERSSAVAKESAGSFSISIPDKER